MAHTSSTIISLEWTQTGLRCPSLPNPAMPASVKVSKAHKAVNSAGVSPAAGITAATSPPRRSASREQSRISGTSICWCSI